MTGTAGSKKKRKPTWKWPLPFAKRLSKTHLYNWQKAVRAISEYRNATEVAKIFDTTTEMLSELLRLTIDPSNTTRAREFRDAFNAGSDHLRQLQERIIREDNPTTGHVLRDESVASRKTVAARRSGRRTRRSSNLCT